MINMNNFGILRGRLTDDPQVYPNSNGSKKILFIVAVQNNYVTTSTGKKGSQFIPVEVFISKDAEGIGPYANIHKGDKVSLMFGLKNNNYTDKNGNKHYGITVDINQISFDESKTVCDNRLAQRVAIAENPDVNVDGTDADVTVDSANIDVTADDAE